jgi:NAD(P)-dependent dehydrogenase (short-subunit alcohol dehydrogenase family)
MQGKVVLVTGAKGGLGTDITRAFLSAGATVVGTSRSIKQTDFAGSNFTAISADITQSSATRELVASVVDRFKRIDVLIHVMGGFAAGKIHETDDETWNKMLDLNTTSGFYIGREVIRAMRASGGGRIVAIGSLAATDPHPGIGAYVASKSALLALFRTIALENMDAGITSNIILPGTMDTPANRAAMPTADFSKWVQPAEVAKVVLTLAGDQGAQINGAVIPVYGRDD